MRAYSGVSLHVHRKLAADEVRFAHPAFDIESRIVSAQVGNTVFASVYVPNGGKDYAAKLNFLARMIEWIGALHAEGRSLVLCGDINVAHDDMDVHPKERKAGVIGQRPEERALFERLLGGRMVDVARAAAPQNADLFTWWPPWRNMRQRNIGWRIDYVLASKSIAQRATECRVLADVGTSDHAPVMLTTG